MSVPPPDVIEVSLIGPGYGESIIVHLGDGDWMIVDSCIQKLNEGGTQSAAVTYLRGIGVDLASQVSRVVATHWHNDHIGGLSQVVEECASADFCCAMALREDEFLGFAAAYAEADPSPLVRSTREIMDVLGLLETEARSQLSFCATPWCAERIATFRYTLSPHRMSASGTFWLVWLQVCRHWKQHNGQA